MPSSAELAEVSLSRVRWRSGEFVTAQFHEDSASERVLAVQPAQIERNITSLWAFGCNLLRSVGALKNSVAWRDSKRKLKRKKQNKEGKPQKEAQNEIWEWQIFVLRRVGPILKGWTFRWKENTSRLIVLCNRVHISHTLSIPFQ